MRRYRKRFWLLAVCLSSLAGFVDAVGFLQLGGLFVSFMSGNSTRMAVGMAAGNRVAATAAALVGIFLLGVLSGSLVAAFARHRRKPAVLTLVCLLLCAASLLPAFANEAWTPLVLAAAMGAMNCVFQRDGEVTVGVTYMTGTLVKLGQHLAAALLGRSRFGWAPFLFLWAGLVAGGVCGTILFRLVGQAALWVPSAATGLLAILALRLGPAPPVSGERPVSADGG